MSRRYYIEHWTEGAEDAYVLCDPDGNVVPHQCRTTLVSSAGTLPRFIIEFEAGSQGLQVIDEREEPDATK